MALPMLNPAATYGLGFNEDLIRRGQKEKYYRNYNDARDQGLVQDSDAENAAHWEDYQRRSRELEDAGVKSPFDRGDRILWESDLFGEQQIFKMPQLLPKLN